MLQLYEITLDLILSKVFVYTTQTIRTPGTHNRRGPLLYGVVITAIYVLCQLTFVIWSCDILELLILMMRVRASGS